jgi:hypothetical protein
MQESIPAVRCNMENWQELVCIHSPRSGFSQPQHSATDSTSSRCFVERCYLQWEQYCGDFLLRQSDIGSNAVIVLMNDAKDSGLLRVRGQRLDSVLFSQSNNRHITTSTWTVPSSFTASFPPHFTCFACI